ncbi:MAG: tetratricopeptide repeat protein [Krumholzibacteria bacterium]|nr:tetratricopeptide repeat protein [Candidatus Krumholzibacteria bacterium]
MSELLFIPAAAVIAVVGILVWRTFRAPVRRAVEDGYQQALELWISGERDEAVRVLTSVVKANPEAVDPFLTLGNLLRRRGDASRAAVLHRGLTLRADLPRGKKITVGLALAEDLVALQRWDDAREVLDSVMKDASDRAAYWKVRFAQWQGQGNLPEAARTLKAAPRFVAERDRPWFVKAYVAFQLDRARAHAARGEAADARARLKDVEKIPEAAIRAALVRAVLAAVTDDAHEAVTVASEELLDSPEELAIFLPLLQDVLLRTGQYARTIPILERACQSETAPPRLWISLALLYEKLDQRPKALRLLEAKAGRPNFTPDAAEPYLRVLMREAKGTDAARVWSLLARPARPGSWTCAVCGRREEQVRWFCDDCRAFDSFTRDRRGRREN